ncbi:lipid droplet-associated hydrolase [Echinops telfairi]|uniref:Lipid droplet-associated hydrolase n=1 Tax=Echinops telfairi TaxID=9371 RepID=A0ABM0IB62_ECHTE|nr:lipid droplet-associated hydrolase [Echinops telfairi]
MDSEIKEEVPVQEKVVLSGGVETLLLQCGPWTDLFSDQGASRPKVLILIIPGNPSFISFYLTFAKALFSLINGRFPVWTVSHAGHSYIPKDKKILGASDDSSAQKIKDIYGLCGQTEHKLAFLRTHVPKEMKLVLIGHSVGCYISLQMLRRAPELPVIRSLMLFPTIERMAETPKGKFVTPLLCWLQYVLRVLCYILFKPIPEFIKSFLVRFMLKVNNLPKECFSLSLLEPFCLANAVYLGAQEMEQIVKRDDEIIKKHLSKLTFYYGTIDHWCPIEFYNDLKKDFPEGDIRLCEKKMRHDFILRWSQEMAELVADWLKADLSKI